MSGSIFHVRSYLGVDVEVIVRCYQGLMSGYRMDVRCYQGYCWGLGLL